MTSRAMGLFKPSSARTGSLSDRARADLLTRFLTAQAGLLTRFLTALAGLLTRFLTRRAPDRF